MVPVIPPSTALDIPNSDPATTAFKPGHGAIRIYQVKGIGTDAASGTESANDIVFNINYLTRDTCLAINDLLKVTNPNGNPPAGTTTGSAGSYINGSLSGARIMDEANTNGQFAFCRYLATNQYQYIHVLVER